MSHPNTLLDSVSFITKISQQMYDSRTEDNLISFAGVTFDFGGTESGYWCHIQGDDKGNVSSIQLQEEFVYWTGNPFSDPHDIIYVVMGWCAYHKIECELVS
tara:strand:- start:12 stop:317 length:306 start_codon:yes stop_codon:yes gene_type:complete